MNLGLNIVDGVRRLDLEGDCLSREGLHENLHPTTKTKHQVKGRFLLDIVIRKGAPIFELFASEDQALLVWRNPGSGVRGLGRRICGGDLPLLILDLCLHIVNSVRGLHLEGDGLSGQSLHKDLHVGSKDYVRIRVRVDALVEVAS